MLVDKTVIIKCNGHMSNYYKSKGYDAEYNKIIEINIDDLPRGSSVKVKVKCDICGKEKMLTYEKYMKNISKYNIYTCSTKCAQIKNIKTNNIRYGVDNPLQNKEIHAKVDNTNLIRYGKKNVFENDEIKKKCENTMIKKHGVKHAMKSEELREKACETNQKRYGKRHVSQVPEFKQKMEETNLRIYGKKSPMQNKKIRKKTNKTIKNKYNVDNISQLPEIKRENAKKLFLVNQQMYKDKYNLNVISYDIKKHTYIIHCDECENDYKIHTSLLSNRLFKNKTVCTKCNPYSTFNSDFEGKLTKFIKENYNGKIKKDRTILSGQELDVYLPDLNLAFEFNGLYWHSDINKENNYHKNKTDLCEQHNVRLIHIFEDEWNNKTDIVKSFILSLLVYPVILNLFPFFIYCNIINLGSSNSIDTYLYKTTNGGNNWEMKNVQMEDEEMKGDLDKGELQNLIKKLNLKIVK
jgi:hypothetical protein